MISKSTILNFSKKEFDQKYKQARWANLDEAELLREWVRAADPDLVMESGTANGFSALWLASGLKDGAELHTFDPINRPKLWEEFEHKLPIIFHRTKFMNIGDFIKPSDKKIVAFIDGDHGMLSVLEDWAALRPLLKKNDVILFHDYREGKVQQAIAEILKENPTSRRFIFKTVREICVIIFDSQTIPIGDESSEPIVIRFMDLIAKEEKVRETKWASSEKPWTQYESHALHTSSECHLFYETAKRLGPGNYANLGVFKGMSVACLAFGLKHNNHKGTIYAVDTYNLENLTEYPEKMLSKLASFGIDFIKVCKGTTVEWAKKVDCKFKFILIDAGHRYQDIKDDFEMWAPFLEEGGEIGIHDVEYSNIQKYIEEDVEPHWELVEHVWRTKIYKRRV